MSRAVLSIGSNLGDRLVHLRSVVEAFAPHLVAVSSVYST
ncbi:2-amino-4-hydroxy-6-hydroxymethyldihydropteridine diphosphokinase, partial [Nocardia gipuzkoensis]